MMPSSIEMLNAIKNHLKQNSQTAGKTAMQIRLELAESAKRLQQLPDISAEKADMNGLQGEWVNACKDHNPEDRRKVILYFHGGGFISGSCEVYRDLAARISAASGAPVLTVEYRLAPEHVYPAANDDCYSAYCRLLETGLQPENIILGGDSVGATLALMTMITLRESGGRLPAAAFLLSPHGDLVHLDGESYDSKAELDPTGSREGNRRILRDYLGGYAGEPPALLSPLKLCLHGLPPLLIQAGDQEVLLSDAERLAERIRAEGGEVTLEIWENMWSVFQMMSDMLPEAQEAIGSMGSFVRKMWKL
ncbi:alpha/beta hydrolase [Paenibacillus sonchi]|uniref:alpha/beta hydrolase n=1 Tax=Paenibacillus sonchi TaxID=373687 RepID=UPI00031A8516|nr:alpha/beta hydrolase [Paenibacillus sonchi]